VRGRSAVPAARRELEVCGGARHLEKHPVVAVVIPEAPDLGQAETVAVERHDLAQPLGVAGNSQRVRHADRQRRTRPAASAATLPPSFVQRSASMRASRAPPTITLSVVRGPSSDAHRVPQRQHVSS
jgi:hypothetical protein